MTTMLTRFAAEPVSSDSAQFPLARPRTTAESTDTSSPEGVRAWGLRSMQTLPSTGRKLPAWRYDHDQQVAVDSGGSPLRELRMDPSAESVSSNDGDEGPSEDWKYDFMPDSPGLPV